MQKGLSDAIKHGFFTFSSIFFPNFLACERCLNTSLCWLTTTSGLQYGPESFSTHLNISHIYELVFTKFIANSKYVLKINEQLLKRTGNQNPLDKTLKKKNGEGGWHPPPPSLVRARVNPQTARTFIISHKRSTICLFASFLSIVLFCFVLCGFFIFVFHMKRSLEFGKYFISPKAVLR